MDNFAQNLKNLRKNRKWTQQRLAEKLKVSASVVKNWESGKYYPHMYTLLDISELFDVSLDTLIKGKVERVI